MKILNHCRPDADHKPGQCKLCDFYQSLVDQKNTFPHCDAYVVHAPTECEYCDKYASNSQKWRRDNGVNFTGETDPNKMPCPATTRRKVDKINKWYGNISRPKACAACGAKAVYINLALACPKHGPIQ